MIDARSGKRWPIWAEIDFTVADPAKAVLEIHPAVNFESGPPLHRRPARPRQRRRAARSKRRPPSATTATACPPSSRRSTPAAARSRAIFQRLQRSGIQRDKLYLAWHFTVASDENNSARALAMRDAAFGQLGDTDLADLVPQGSSPSFQVTSVETAPNPGQVARRVKGSFEVPCYLFPTCAPGGTMQLDAAGTPLQNGTWTANFDCIVPESVVTGPARDGAAVALRARPLRQRRRGRLQPPARPLPGPRDRPLRDRRDRHVASRPAGGGRERCRTSRASPRSPTGCSRACSTSSTWDGR